MNQIHAMRVFVRVAASGSFRCAAREFHVSNALVSRAIALLEGHLKTRLLNRNTRTISLTEAGAHYLEGCRALLEELDELETAVTRTQAEPSGTLRVAASNELSPRLMTRLMSEFHEANPGVRISLTLIDRPVDLIGNGYDVGISAGITQSKALVERTFGADPLTPVATPAFIAEYGRPALPIDLQPLPFIGLRDDAREAAFHFRHQYGGATEQVMLDPVYSVNDGSMVHVATRSNMGFSILPSAMVQDDLKKGALVRLLAAYSIDEPVMKMSIVFPARRDLSRKTRAFIDFASEKLRQVFAAETCQPEETRSPASQHQVLQPDCYSAHAPSP